MFTGSPAAVNPVSPLVTWSRTFPSAPGQIRAARQFLAGILDGCPAGDDAVLCVSELATNALIHGNAGNPSATFSVGVSRHGSRLRVEVGDSGGPWAPGPHGDGQQGRGLLIVSQLAAAWGTSGGGVTPRTVWFEMITR